MATDLPNDESTDIPAAIRRRREELFGPKAGRESRPVDAVESALRTGPPGLEMAEMTELDSTQVKYEMELGAHRQTVADLLAAKDAPHRTPRADHQ